MRIILLAEFFNKLGIVFINSRDPVPSTVYESCNILIVIVDRSDNMNSVHICSKLYAFRSRASFNFYIQERAIRKRYVYRQALTQNSISC